MELSEDEILEEADRIRVRRGLRIARECARCGGSFLASGPDLYCSEACSEAAARGIGEQWGDKHKTVASIGTRRRGESIREFIIRERAKLVEHGEMSDVDARLTDDDEAFIATTERLEELRRQMSGNRVFDVDSTEILREEREKRSRYQASLHDLDTWRASS